MRNSILSPRTWLRTRFLILALGAVWIVISVGTALAEGWPILDSFYYGMASMTTVGYGDFVPVTAVGRFLSVVLVPVSIVLGFGIGLLVVQESFKVLMTRKEFNMVSADIKDHYIICGYGKIGKFVARNFARVNRPICIVEKNPELQSRLEEEGYPHVIGDAMDSQVMIDSGLDRAAAVIATFESDVDNVYLVLEVRDMRKDVTIISGASSVEAARRLKLAGASRVVSPAALAGEIMAKSALNPEIIDFMSDVTDATATSTSFAQVTVEEDSWLAGKPLHEVAEKVKGVRVMMTKQHDSVNLTPHGGLELEPGMVLLVVGPPRAIEALSTIESPGEELGAGS